ncbi:hypothetical protein IV203_012968 [Nitzschia inconspicua]|uniref:Uncharacterized protein n=1 Tax=Nitzschia inconspicua TaxID=303405 RepID=A0A9K3Q7M1_9STRA|nr:hypothetical protein IV203_012968 [Nitzschia inconspicua]
MPSWIQILNRIIAVTSLVLQDSLLVSGKPSTTRDDSANKQERNLKKNARYEVWGSDQSNSVAGVSTPGTKGSFIWIWNSTQIDRQLAGDGDAVPMTCTRTKANGPCDLLEAFPEGLVDSVTGLTLGALPGFGRLHGVIQDPYGKYVAASVFVPGGGYVGIIDTNTKQAIALFRVTGFTFEGQTTSARSVHMCIWSDDGKALLVDNLDGKAIERIDVTRNKQNVITDLKFNKAATIGLGRNMAVADEASVFSGPNAFGVNLIGSVVGSYSSAGLDNLTPNGVCKENGCGTAPNGAAGGRPNNLPICPIASKNGLVYVTLAGGGLFILNSSTTPMRIVGEYGNRVVYGAGCGGVQKNNQVFLNAGVAASAAGATQSMFAVVSFDDRQYSVSRPQNTPMPVRVFQDAGNTKTGGNIDGAITVDESGQLPGVSTRRDSHGMAIAGNYLHVADRIQNVIETFHVNTYERSTYDVVSITGQAGRTGAASKCFQRSLLDDENLILNDPAPDLFETTPDGKYLMIAFRGPVPVSVAHAGQGSCPGVGIVQLTEGGKSGKLLDILRSTNTVDTSSVSALPGGVVYAGKERSDVHGAIVVAK